MSTPVGLRGSSKRPPRHRRLLAMMCVAAAKALMRVPPERIEAILAKIRRGARPAGRGEVLLAQQAVMAASLSCCGGRGCLPRSLATTLLCRVRGTWPTWCVGVRRMAPFDAHAWVEVDGEMLGEPYPAGYFAPLVTVSPAMSAKTARAARSHR